MKGKFYALCVILTCVVVLSGCYKEEPIAQEEYKYEHEEFSRIESIGIDTEDAGETGSDQQEFESDSDSTGEENESDSIDTSDSREATSVWESEPVSELVESESVSEAELEGQLGEYSGNAETGYSDGFTDEYAVAGSPEEYNDGGYSEPSEDVWSGEKGLIYLGVWASTGYCPGACCCGEWASGYTASGTLATEGRTVACGSLPMGTEIYIEGHGYRIVEDLGVDGEWVDIFYEDHASASAHGLQYVDVYLVN